MDAEQKAAYEAAVAQYATAYRIALEKYIASYKVIHPLPKT